MAAKSVSAVDSLRRGRAQILVFVENAGTNFSSEQQRASGLRDVRGVTDSANLGGRALIGYISPRTPCMGQ
eukprot:scaffold11_cov257-Pinguiococcus_pyrenoidosus.AAC.25